MRKKQPKSLKLVKASVANLDKQTKQEVIGGRTRAFTDCGSLQYSICATSCHAH
jgi:hypothetical protein